MADNNKEPEYRRGNKARLRLSTKRRKRRYPLEKKGTTYGPKKHTDNENLLSGLDEESQENPITVGPGTPKEGMLVQNTGFVVVPQDIDKKEEESFVLEGRRIVDIGYFMNSLLKITNHNPTFECRLENLIVIGETSQGLSTTIHLKCNFCNLTFNLPTNDSSEEINEASVMGIMQIGCGHSHLQQFTTALNIPCFSEKFYQKMHDKVADAWEEEATKAMKEAAEEEKKISFQLGEVSSSGKALVPVVCDGSWPKRSFKSHYNSLSGCAAIVGYRTQKVLFLGVRNKYCVICKKSEKHDQPTPHVCWKNWDGSSTAMEADILTEGFVRSVQMYDVIFNSMIADGDSSCYKRICDADPYKVHGISVRKIECRNHLLRNYIKKMSDLSKDVSSGPLILRKKIKENLPRLRWAVTKAIAYRKSCDLTLEDKINELRKDILNSPSHIFGEHKECEKRGYFCNAQPNQESVFKDMKLTDLYSSVNNHVNYLARHSNSLIYDVDSNSVEQFNAKIAKFIGGKRVNYTRKRSYQARCSGAVLSHNTSGALYTRTMKNLTGRSPQGIIKKNELKRRSLLLQIRSKALEKNKIRARRKLLYTDSMKDCHYGEHCNKPDMPVSEYEVAKTSYLESQKKSEEEIIQIELGTRLQRNSESWKFHRKNRLTASRFSEVCHARLGTNKAPLVGRILYPPLFINAASVRYGIENENKALEELSEKLGNKIIMPCGLFIDKEYEFLAATPDGLLDEDGIVEVKCIYSCRYITPEQGILSKKINFWRQDGSVNTNDKWYYQVQGQLNITEKRYCVFAAWTELGLKMEIIMRDKDFWQKKMLPKLKLFYFQGMLPEIVDSRRARNMPLRDCVY